MTQLTDEQNFGLADEVYENDNLIINETIKLSDKSKWVVINSVNDPSGLQSIAVVPLKDYQNMQSGKIKDYPNVIFSARGSQTDDLSEFNKDWIETDGGSLGTGGKPSDLKDAYGLNVSGDKNKLAYSEGWNQFPQLDDELKNMVSNNQFLGMERFVNETLKKNSIKDYSFTGHSLGGALAQYMAVLTDKYATTFAAAKAYRLLPPELQKLVDQGYFNSKIVDYRHSWDPVGHVPLGEIIGRRYVVPSGAMTILIIGHMRGSFQNMFDKDGAMLLDELLGGSIARSEIALYNHLRQIGSLKSQWGSRGPMTENQEIFLDQSEAIAVLSNTQNVVQSSLDTLMVIYEGASNDAQDLWTKTLSSAEGIGANLNYSEVIDALERGTATESFIVREPQANHDKKKAELKEIVASYDQLIHQLTESISKMAQHDSQIASALQSLS